MKTATGPKARLWKIQAKADNPKIGEVYLYGPISSELWWGDEITPKALLEELATLGDVDELIVYVNSEGGDVFAGQAMRSIFARHKAATKTAYVDGLAASAMSLVLTAFPRVVMYRNVMQMVHNPVIGICGWWFASELRKYADDLDAIREPMISAYEEKTGLKRDEIAAIMDAESWLTAEEAVKLGFADEIEEAKDVAASWSLDGRILSINGRQIDLSQFRNFPGQAKPKAADPPSPESQPKAQEDPGPARVRFYTRKHQQNARMRRV